MVQRQQVVLGSAAKLHPPPMVNLAARALLSPCVTLGRILPPHRTNQLGGWWQLLGLCQPLVLVASGAGGKSLGLSPVKASAPADPSVPLVCP